MISALQALDIIKVVLAVTAMQINLRFCGQTEKMLVRRGWEQQTFLLGLHQWWPDKKFRLTTLLQHINEH